MEFVVSGYLPTNGGHPHGQQPEIIAFSGLGKELLG